MEPSRYFPSTTTSKGSNSFSKQDFICDIHGKKKKDGGRKDTRIIGRYQSFCPIGILEAVEEIGGVHEVC